MKRIALVLLDGFADWEGALLAAAARSWLGGEVAYHTPEGAPVRSMGGALIEATGAIESLVPAATDALVLVGSSAWEAPSAPDLAALLHAAERGGMAIGAICGGTLALARAGLLDERPHTSNAMSYLQTHVPRYRGRDAYRDVPTAVTAGRVVTAPGSAPATFAAALLALAWPGDPVCDRILRLMAREHASPAAAP